MKKLFLGLFFLLCPCWIVWGQQNEQQKRFDILSEKPAQLVFEDNFRHAWSEKWHLDGENAKIIQKDGRLEMYAGGRAYVDADHLVLWTKEEFKGNLKIEYDFTRLDSSGYYCVNILYIQAQGAGRKPFVKDIFKWNELRKVPRMSMYLNNMDTYHISYAVTGVASEDKPEYIRARRYMPQWEKGLEGTELKPEYLNTGLFKIGVTYHLTFIKYETNLYMNVKGDGQDKTFYFDASAFPKIDKGRVGLRQMYTLNSKYENFRVYQLYK